MKNQFLKIISVFVLGLLSFNLSAQEINSYEVDAKFQQQLNQVFNEGNSLNTAFMSDDGEEVNKAAHRLTDAMSGVDISLLKGQAYMDWMKYLRQMNGGLEKMTATNSIIDQRQFLIEFSAGLYASIKAFGVGTEVFYQFCPMANSSKGAYWLSDSGDIKNPYMGSMMPKCGLTKETLN